MSKLLFFVIALVLAALPRIVFAETIGREELVHPTDEMAGVMQAKKYIQVGPWLRCLATINVTAKGNGTLDLCNLHLRVFDAHDDGQIYDGDLLHIEFVDIDNDGFKDLVICGVVRHTGEKESDSVASSPLVSVYRYDRKIQQYHLAYRYGPDLEVK